MMGLTSLGEGAREIKMPKKIYIYKGFGQTLEFAESLGWKDTYPDSADDEYDGPMADGIEEIAIGFIEDNGYVIIMEEENQNDKQGKN